MSRRKFNPAEVYLLTQLYLCKYKSYGSTPGVSLPKPLGIIYDGNRYNVSEDPMKRIITLSRQEKIFTSPGPHPIIQDRFKFEELTEWEFASVEKEQEVNIEKEVTSVKTVTEKSKKKPGPKPKVKVAK